MFTVVLGLNQKCSADYHRYYNVNVQTAKGIDLISNGRGVFFIIYSCFLKIPFSAEDTGFKSLKKKINKKIKNKSFAQFSLNGFCMFVLHVWPNLTTLISTQSHTVSDGRQKPITESC